MPAKAVAGSILFLSLACAASASAGDDVLRWQELPELPPVRGKERQPGLAGAFSGVHRDALIVAGGANFPDGLPWSKLPDGTSPRKIYHRDIYVLLRDGGKYTWSVAEDKLPAGYSYGVSIATDDGLLCIGGEWREYEGDKVRKLTSDKVFVIRHVGRGGVEISDRLNAGSAPFPALPEGCSAMAGASIGSVVYVAGGNNGQRETRSFWSLDLSRSGRADEFVWERLPPWPGPARSHLIAAAQSDGVTDCFYIFSGRYRDPARGWICLSDAYRYNPRSATWARIADVGTNLTDREPVCVMAGTGLGMGANHILLFGGASGERFRQVEQELPRRIKALQEAGKTQEADLLIRKKNALYADHPGFSRTILAYHTITDTWTRMGRVPESVVDGLRTGSHVTSVAVRWGSDVVIPSGEVRPGVRSPKVWLARRAPVGGFGAANYAVLGAYLLAVVAMGVYFSKREKTTDDFFKAGGRVPWWAAGISIFGTQLSAITFMAIPAKSFATDWTWFVGNMTIVAVAPLIVLLFLPFYRRLNVTTAYEYIERRFNTPARVLASAMFMLFQFARIGIVLYLPSIALSVVTGVDIRICIGVIGVLSILYTVMGGIEAVIWTDVLQVVVLLGGALLVLVLIPFRIEGGWNGLVDIAEADRKLRLLDFHFRWDSPTFWVFLFGGMSANLISYGSDQTVIQRYLTTRDEKGAARGIWTNAILTIPASLIFFGIGTALYGFFKSHPQTLNPTVVQSDAIFPWFIVRQLPVGIAGLLIAGVFAAAMSSVDSSMNSVATAFTTDFYRRFKSGTDERTSLRVARGVTVVVGGCGMAFALVMATWEIKSLWEQFVRFIGLFGGGLGGLFILAIFTRRATGPGAIVGLLGSAVVQFLLRSGGVVHGMLFAATGMASCFVIGYVASVLIPGGRKNLDGLTLYTLDRAEDKGPSAA